MKKKTYYVHGNSYDGKHITTEYPASDYIGEFATFAEAKKEAVDSQKTTVSDFELDVKEAKNHLKYLRSLKASDLD